MPLCIKLFKLRTMKDMQSKRIHFPNTNEYNEACKKLRSAVYADHYNLIRHGTTSLFTRFDDQGISIDMNSSMKLYLNDGCAGAGHHVIWKCVSIKISAKYVSV